MCRRGCRQDPPDQHHRQQGVQGKELLDLFALTTPGWMTWYSKSDQYSKQKLSADIEALRSFYLNRVTWISNRFHQVSITPDKKTSTSPLSITEGEKYPSPTSSWPARWSVPEADLRPLLEAQGGDTFSRDSVTATKGASPTASATRAMPSPTSTPPRGGQGQARGRLHLLRRSGPAGVCAQDQLRRQRPHPRRGAAPRDAPDGRRLVRRRGHQPLRRCASTASATSRTSPSRPCRAGLHRPGRRQLHGQERATGNLMLGAGFSSAEKTHPVRLHRPAEPVRHRQRDDPADEHRPDQPHDRAVLHQPLLDGGRVSIGWDVYQRNVDPTSLSVATYKSSSIGAGVRFSYPSPRTTASTSAWPSIRPRSTSSTPARRRTSAS